MMMMIVYYKLANVRVSNHNDDNSTNYTNYVIDWRNLVDAIKRFLLPPTSHIYIVILFIFHHTNGRVFEMEGCKGRGGSQYC